MGLKLKFGLKSHFFFFCFLLQCNSGKGQRQSSVGDGGVYRIRSVANENFLTAGEDGIVGLRTGIVSTFPRDNTPAQAWKFTWEPIEKEEYQGYWIQSKQEFLNAVTSYYFPGTSQAFLNVWKLKQLGEGRWQIENYRTGECLQLAKNNLDVEEGKCDSSNLKTQQWNIIPIIKKYEEDD